MGIYKIWKYNKYPTLTEPQNPQKDRPIEIVTLWEEELGEIVDYGINSYFSYYFKHIKRTYNKRENS